MAKTTASDYFRDDVAMVRGLLKALKTSNREAMLAKSIILNVMDLILLELQESVWKIYDVEKDETELGRRMLVCRGLKKDYARLMEKLFEELDGADDQLDDSYAGKEASRGGGGLTLAKSPERLGGFLCAKDGDLTESRTRIDGMKTRCTNRYTMRPRVYYSKND